MIRAYDVGNDQLLWQQQTAGPINSSPAVGDIHPVPPYTGVEIAFGNDAGEIHLREKVLGHSIDPWPYTIVPGWIVRTSAAIANINGDANLDIVIGANNQNIYAFKYDRTYIAAFPLPLFGNPLSPLIGDIDGDEKSEIIFSSDDGYLHVWKNPDSQVSQYKLEWPQFHHDYQRTGVYGWSE
ncbi:MAG: VCBS repeat-containing protein, partial [bacterium]